MDSPSRRWRSPRCKRDAALMSQAHADKLDAEQVAVTRTGAHVPCANISRLLQPMPGYVLSRVRVCVSDTVVALSAYRF